MPNPKPAYPSEFRAEAVRLESLRKWIAQHEIDSGQPDGLTTTERQELARLRRENRHLREEREILKKAAAFFAQETNKNRQ